MGRTAIERNRVNELFFKCCLEIKQLLSTFKLLVGVLYNFSALFNSALILTNDRFIIVCVDLILVVLAADYTGIVRNDTSI